MSRNTWLGITPRARVSAIGAKRARSRLASGSGGELVPAFSSFRGLGRRWRRPLVVWIVSALEHVFVFEDLSVIGGAFYNFGIPKDIVLRMEAALKADKFLVVMRGTASEVGDARKLLITLGVAEVLEYLAGTCDYGNAA